MNLTKRFHHFARRGTSSIEAILRDLKRSHYAYPGSFQKSAKRAQRVARQQKWLNKAQYVGSYVH